MKKTLIALAAAATVSLGAIGAASAAPTASLDMTVKTGVSTQEVGYRYGYRSYGYGYRHHGYGYGRFYCKQLHYKGYVLGYAWARFKYVRHCGYRYGY
ncbi:MAG TPA: hypothetical protein VM325_08055 [Alphaproteobacteria bacterium]|nr:hypothetical protein [Alphaproteobacteria bacterium]